MSSSLATTPPPLAASLLPKLEGLTTGQDPALQMAYVVSALLILTWLCGSGRETTSESTGRRRLNRELGHTRLLDVIVSEAHPKVMQRDDDDGENRYVASNSFAASGSTGDLDAFAVHAAAASQPNACETGPRSGDQDAPDLMVVSADGQVSHREPSENPRETERAGAVPVTEPASLGLALRFASYSLPSSVSQSVSSRSPCAHHGSS